MAFISLRTIINAPIERVFDLSRSIDLHITTTKETNEKAIAGITTGLINLNETVTWEAYHLFKKRQFTSKITTLEKPFRFTDEMIKGNFRFFQHQHFFNRINDQTEMLDKIHFKSPYGFIGSIVDILYLKKYLEKFLIQRNQCIKSFAESDKWKQYI